jgi:Tol biopolymer transport system component
MASFWGEIRRRKVFQVAVAYAIVGWLLAQVAATTFPVLLLPDWILRAFVIILLLGFPLAVVLAWAFEATPAGIKRDAGTAAENEPGNATLYIAGALIVGLTLGGLFGRTIAPEPPPADSIRTPIQLTANPQDNPVIASSISPTGKYLAYTVASGLYLRVIDSGEFHQLALPPDISLSHSELDWYPDETNLLLAARIGTRSYLWKLSILGGQPRSIAEDAISAVISPDGASIAYLKEFFSRQVYTIGPNGESPRVLIDQDALSIREMAWSPDAKFLLVGGNVNPDLTTTRLQAIDVSSGDVTRIMEDPRTFQHWRGYLPFFWLPDGRLLYGRTELAPHNKVSNIWQVNIEPATAALSSDPVRVTSLTGFNVRSVSSSVDGDRVSLHLEENQLDVYVADIASSGQALDNVRRFTFDERDDTPTGWSPDSGELFFVSDRGAIPGLFSQGRDDGDARAIGGVFAHNEGHSQLSPNGRWILFWDRNMKLMRTPVDGGPSEVVLEATLGSDFNCPLIPRPDYDCVVSIKEPDNAYGFYAFNPEYGLGNRLVSVSIEGRPPFYNWSLSPDGQSVALVHNQNILRIIDLESGDETPHTLDGWILGEYVAWSTDGRGLFMDGNDNDRTFKKALIHYSLEDRAGTVLRERPSQWHVTPKSSPDGRHLAFGLMVYSGNAWMIENP